MKRILGSKILTAVAVGIVLLTFATAVWNCVRYYIGLDIFETSDMFLEGEYSVDGGEWQPIDTNKPIGDHFHKIVFKGKIAPMITTLYRSFSISSKNVWYTLKSSDGTIISDYNFENSKISYEHLRSDRPMALDMPNTPGYNVRSVSLEFFKFKGVPENSEMIFEVEYPYEFALESFSDCIDFTVSTENGLYLRFFYETLLPVMLFSLVCFFGLFFFPAAGFILGRVDYRFLTFGLLSFFWGLYMIMQITSGYLNVWIVDPTVCMMIDKITEYCFVTVILFYFKSNMQRKNSRVFANITSLVYLCCVVTVYILHLCAVTDLIATSIYLNIITAVCIIVMVVLLSLETKGNRNGLFFLLSWVPLLLTVTLDIIDHFTHLAGSHYFNFGLTVTMIVQIVGFILALRQQYLNTIRYEKMQKELYEAKVGIMVSQIQPHFMYNALTSIAMMCTIDPDTAQEATVTFAKYLRGNMDSLKQAAPVPFSRELEHLKKYLYIEKLRFGNKLNIEYDIQTTDFVLPQLSIQPLVENAVKHGVGMKKKGGTVTIATRETDTAFEVIISDDGVGFDVSAERKDNGRSHVGMENTRRRINGMCGGEVKIESTVGEGTTAVIILPKDKQNYPVKND